MYNKNLCRACLSAADGEMCPLFSDNTEMLKTGLHTIADVLNAFTSVLIDTNDNLPDHICLECYDEVQRAYTFKLKCEKSDMILHQLKEGKVNLRKLKDIDCERIQNLIVDCKPEEVLSFYNDASETDKIPQNTQIVNKDYDETAFHVTVKTEPDLDISFNDESIDYSESESNEELKCSACSNAFESLDTFRQHIITKHIEENLCRLCNKEFECSQYEHTTKHLPPSYSNETTNENSSESGKDSVKASEPKLVSGQARFACTICPNVSYKTQTCLARHKEKMHNDDVYKWIKCRLCSIMVPNEKEYLTHMINEHNCQKPFKCEYCGLLYRQQMTLRYHLRAKHSNEIAAVNVFQCEICSKILPYKSRYIVHMRTHTGESPHQCKICSEKFIRVDTLKAHIEKKHTAPDNPNYKCKICSKVFGYSNHLTSHMLIHTGEKPYDCKICSEKFRCAKYLKNHMRTKHTDKVYDGKPVTQCIVCSRVFGFNYELIRHMRLHTDERPFKCELCSKAFRQKENLNGHILRYHNNDVN